VKGYQLWCVDPKSRKFIISKGVTFDEYAIFHKKKKSIGIDVEMDQGTSKHIELEVRVSNTVQKYALVELVEEVVQNIFVKNAHEEQPYNIATGRQKIQIKPPVKYGYANLVYFDLNIAENIDDYEPYSYKEIISCK
jgi:hypothetical protein